MTAYVVVEGKISDAEKFARYAEKAQALIRSFGGELEAVRGETETLEGDWNNSKIALQRWPNMAVARRYWNSPEFAEIKKMRDGTGEFRAILIEGTS